MKILFVSMVAFENNTSATIQNKGIVRGLVELKHDVDIMTLRPSENTISYDDSMNDIHELVKDFYYIEIDPKYALMMAKKPKAGGGEVKTKKGTIHSLMKKTRLFIKRAYESLSIFDAQKHNVKNVSKLNVDYSKYDLIISASDPKSSHLIVRKIFQDHKKCQAKWIQYWGDPMLIDITRKSDWKDRFVKYQESKLISQADRVVYASPLTLEKQKECFPSFASKMGYANQAFINVSDRSAGHHDSKDHVVTAGYFGAYRSSVRNILPLYHAAQNAGFALRICGASDVVLENTENISVYGTVPYHKVLEMEEEVDILVCICNREGTQIPGKIYYCSAYKKPIIVVLDGEYSEELRKYFEKFQRFILCENKEELIQEAIEKAKSELGKKVSLSEQLTPTYVARMILGGLNEL